jgi:hypothetical protein
LVFSRSSRFGSTAKICTLWCCQSNANWSRADVVSAGGQVSGHVGFQIGQSGRAAKFVGRSVAEMAFLVDPKGGESNWLWTLAWTEANLCKVFIRLHLSIVRSRRRKGRWLFSFPLHSTPLDCWHGDRPPACDRSTLSGVGVSGKPGAVQTRNLVGVAVAAPHASEGAVVVSDAAFMTAAIECRWKLFWCLWSVPLLLAASLTDAEVRVVLSRSTPSNPKSAFFRRIRGRFRAWDHAASITVKQFLNVAHDGAFNQDVD